MADYVWSVTGRVLGIDRVAGTDADDIEALPSRSLERLLDRGYIQLKVEPGGDAWKGEWVSTTTYALADEVGRNGGVYISKTAANLGNDPASTPASWDVKVAPPVPVEVTQAELDAVSAAMATDAELASGLSGKQDAATAATDAELSAAITALGLGTAATYDVGTNAGEIAVLGAGGTIPIDRVASGTPSGKKFVKDDSTLAVISGKLLSGNGAPPASAPSIRATASSTTNSIVVPAGVQAGDYILLLVTRQTWEGMSGTPAGFTLIDANPYGSPNHSIGLFGKVATGTEGGTTLSGWDSTGYTAQGNTLVVIKDCHATLPLQAWGEAESMTAPAVAAPEGSYLRVGFASRGDSGTFTPSGDSVDVAVSQSGGSSAIWSAVSSGGAGAAQSVSTTGTPNHPHTWVVLVKAAEAASDAVDGDHYLDKTNRQIYGPMVAGAWGAALPIDEVTQAELDALDVRVDALEAAPAAEVTQAELDAVEAKVIGRLLSGSSDPGSAATTPTWVGGAANESVSATHTLTTPAGTQVGDLILVAARCDDGWSITSAPAGMTELVNLTSGDVRVWYKVATQAGAQSFPVGYNDAWYHVSALGVWTGTDGAAPIAQHQTSSTLTAPGLTLEQSSAMVLELHFSKRDNATISGGSGVTRLTSDNARTQLLVKERDGLSGTTTGGTAITTAGSTQWGTHSVAIELQKNQLATALDGDFYLNKSSRELFGPKSGVSWGAAIPLDEVTQAELDAVEAKIVSTVLFTDEGALAVVTGTTRIYNDSGRTLTISAVRATLTTAGSTDTVVDVNKGGVTLFTTQANRPTLAAAAVTDLAVPDVTTWENGSYLTVDIDTAGTGADTLVVQVTAS